MNTIQEKLQYLLSQYANATATSAEEAELWTLINNAQHDDHIKSIILSMMAADESVSEMDRVQWTPVLDKILGRTEQKTSEEAVVYNLAENRNRFSWKKLAAAAIIIFMAGAGIFYFLRTPDANTKHIAAATSNEPNDITPPSSVNAILTLSNGQKIVLDSAGNGTLARQGGVNVLKLSNGQIVYDPQSMDDSGEEITYNTLSNPSGSKAVNITLADGSRVWLNSESSLRYPTQFSGEDRKVEITGEAYFEVSHNANKPFHVNVKGIDVEVLGTHFNINGYDDENGIKTTLLEGSVRVSNGKVGRIIKPGEQALVPQSGSQNISVAKPDLDEVIAWKNGRFFYNNTDLETIMRQIARWYNVEVIYKDKINYHYTVDVLRNVQVSQLFKFIEMTGGVHFDINGRTIIVRK